MWWILYIGTTAYVLTDAVINKIYFHKRFKEDGYKYTVKNHIGIPEIILGTIAFGAHLIPGVNLIFPIANRDREASYDERVNYMLEAGTIEEHDEPNIKEVKKESDNISIEETIDKLFDKEDNTTNNYRPVNISDSIDQKGYSYKKSLFNKRK